MWQSAGDTDAAITLGVTLWVVIWWIFEPIPIPATSLLPMALLPLFGVLSAKELGAAYGNPLVLLMLGGFLLATALERSGAHRRIAMYMVRAFGGNSSRRLVFGFRRCARALRARWDADRVTRARARAALHSAPSPLAVSHSKRGSPSAERMRITRYSSPGVQR